MLDQHGIVLQSYICLDAYKCQKMCLKVSFDEMSNTWVSWGKNPSGLQSNTADPA